MDKKHIIDYSNELFMRYGIKSVSMDDIASELGISKKTLYQHIDNKESLVKMILDEHIAEDQACIARIEAESTDAIHEMISIAQYVLEILRKINPNTLYDLKKYYRGIYRLWEKFHREHIYQVITSNISKGIQQGWYRSDFDIDIISKLYVAKSMLVVDDLLFDTKTYRRDNVFIENLKYHMHGIASTKGLRLFNKHLKGL